MIRTLYIARSAINDRPWNFVFSKNKPTPIVSMNMGQMSVIFGHSKRREHVICEMWHIEKILPNIAPKGGEVVKVEIEETEDGCIIRRVDL